MTERAERLVALDVFRGLTVAGMLLVNDPGTWSAIYPPLEHAPWHGWTPTDLIFPFFVFIVGITTQLSISARRARGDDERAVTRQILKRGALIFLFGFLVNGFPFFTWGTVTGNADPSFFARVVDRLYHWRIMGVLQRIGVAYVISALIATRVSLKTMAVTAASILVGYWLVKHDFEPAPLVLAFVLGPLMEENLRRAMLIARGDPSVFVTRPISGGLIMVAAILLLIAALPMIRRRRDEVFVE